MKIKEINSFQIGHDVTKALISPDQTLLACRHTAGIHLLKANHKKPISLYSSCGPIEEFNFVNIWGWRLLAGLQHGVFQIWDIQKQAEYLKVRVGNGGNRFLPADSGKVFVYNQNAITLFDQRNKKQTLIKSYDQQISFVHQRDKYMLVGLPRGFQIIELSNARTYACQDFALRDGYLLQDSVIGLDKSGSILQLSVNDFHPIFKVDISSQANKLIKSNNHIFLYNDSRLQSFNTDDLSSVSVELPRIFHLQASKDRVLLVHGSLPSLLQLQMQTPLCKSDLKSQIRSQIDQLNLSDIKVDQQIDPHLVCNNIIPVSLQYGLDQTVLTEGDLNISSIAEPKPSLFNELLLEIRQDHLNIKTILTDRMQALKPIVVWWQNCNYDNAIIAMLQNSDLCVLKDSLEFVKRSRYWPDCSNDLQKAIFKLINQSNIQTHILTGLELIQQTVRRWGRQPKIMGEVHRCKKLSKLAKSTKYQGKLISQRAKQVISNFM